MTAPTGDCAGRRARAAARFCKPDPTSRPFELPSRPGDFATLVYEPYNQSGGQDAILNDTWQAWDASAGLWWSTKNGQANKLTWSAIQALYPDATVLGYGFNLGSNNPNLVVAGDRLAFGNTTTDF